MSAKDIVKLFEEDVSARKRLAELLVGEPDVRLAIINAVLRDVATKSDLEKLKEELRSEFRGEINRLEEEISRLRDRIMRLEEQVTRLEERITRLEERVTGLEERITGLDKRFDMMFKFMLMLNTPILVAVIGILLKMVLAP